MAMRPSTRKTLRDIFLPSLFGGLASAVLAPLVDPHHSFWEMTLAGFIMGFFALGLILAFENLVKTPLMKKFPFSAALAVSTLVDSLIVFSVMVVTVLSLGMQNDTSVKISEMILRQDFLTGVGVFSLMALGVQFLLLINPLIGPGVLGKILLGRYHQPQEGERFFLFLDVKSSTTIAERIGAGKFLSLLNDFFFDLSDAVVLTQGEIYKYVGDEAILVWDRPGGVVRSNPLRCFFLLGEKIRERSEFYLRTYGLVPEFKAGLHFGKVVMGEMGRYRKEIAYLGDTVNSAARIEGECSRFNADLLASKQALDLLGVPEDLEATSLGPIPLRGRDAPVELFSVKRKDIP